MYKLIHFRIAEEEIPARLAASRPRIRPARHSSMSQILNSESISFRLLILTLSLFQRLCYREHIKVKAIRGTLSKAIAYILNPEKTDEKLLVSSYGCASETAARGFEWTRKIAEQKGMNPVRIIARHVIQSFEIGEVTLELAHEIGKQFTDEILGGKYEYVLTTHIDKDHVHNHLIFNEVDFVDYHAYKSYKRIYYDMREVSDRLCKENGLSVIPPSQNKGMSYKEYTEAKRGTSWKQKLKQTIDRLVITAKDYDNFLRLMQEAGYEIKTGKYISFRAEGQERFTRSKTIGENYTEERIKERIAGRTPRRSRKQTAPKGISYRRYSGEDQTYRQQGL